MVDWSLPTTVNIGGIRYKINTDYRDILDIVTCLEDAVEQAKVKTMVALALFYEDFESMPEADWQEAALKLTEFINLGRMEDTTTPTPKRIDWEQDYQLIIAEVNKSAGYEVRTVPYLHWWTFIGYFNTIGDGQFATVCSIREKRRKGVKLESWELEYYRENKARVDLQKRYSPEEQAEIDYYEKLLNGEVD